MSSGLKGGGSNRRWMLGLAAGSALGLYLLYRKLQSRDRHGGKETQEKHSQKSAETVAKETHGKPTDLEVQGGRDRPSSPNEDLPKQPSEIEVEPEEPPLSRSQQDESLTTMPSITGPSQETSISSFEQINMSLDTSKFEHISMSEVAQPDRKDTSSSNLEVQVAECSEAASSSDFISPATTGFELSPRTTGEIEILKETGTDAEFPPMKNNEQSSSDPPAIGSEHEKDGHETRAIHEDISVSEPIPMTESHPKPEPESDTTFVAESEPELLVQSETVTPQLSGISQSSVPPQYTSELEAKPEIQLEKSAELEHEHSGEPEVQQEVITPQLSGISHSSLPPTYEGELEKEKYAKEPLSAEEAVEENSGTVTTDMPPSEKDMSENQAESTNSSLRTKDENDIVVIDTEKGDTTGKGDSVGGKSSHSDENHESHSDSDDAQSSDEGGNSSDSGDSQKRDSSDHEDA